MQPGKLVFAYLLKNTPSNTHRFFSGQARYGPCQTEWIHPLGTGQSQTVIHHPRSPWPCSGNHGGGCCGSQGKHRSEKELQEPLMITQINDSEPWLQLESPWGSSNNTDACIPPPRDSDAIVWGCGQDISTF